MESECLFPGYGRDALSRAAGRGSSSRLPDSLDTHESWPVLLGTAIGVNARLLELEPRIHRAALPRVKNTEANLQAFESEFNEPVSPGYRDFLLHADGWEAFYFGMGIFGLPELREGGNWAPAMELLRTYRDEEVLEAIDIDMDEVMPVAAGQRLNLVVVYRSASPNAGKVVWIDAGEEFGAFDEFKEFFQFAVSLKQQHLQGLESND